MKAGALMLVLLALGAWGVMVQDRSQATTRAELLEEVEVTITDSGVELSRDTFVRGTIPELHVVNESSARRNFVLGVDHSKVLAPGGEDKFVAHLSERGPLAYRVTVNCAAGLSGLITVQ